MSIPIENIYYLLCYAWNKLEEKDRVSVSIDDKTELLDLFAKVLINGSKILMKRGIDRHYIEFQNEIPGIKGKLNISQTLKRNLLFKQKAICSFDELSSNTTLNQILITTLLRLVRTKGLDKGLALELVNLLRMFPNIEEVELRSSLFNKIRLNRNNRFYSFLMNVCQIIYESTLPSEETGKLLFMDFRRDEQKMNKLFEKFILNFYRIEQSKFTSVSGEIIDWKFDQAGRPRESKYLPTMHTDITLQNDTEKVIIDAKYYSETMAINYDKEKIKSVNLYQLFSYLLNQESDDPKTITATGILLYPTIESEYDLQYKYKNHKIEVRTINLNTNWKNIAMRLKQLIQIE